MRYSRGGKMTISSSALVHYVKITKNPVQFSNMCIETQWVGGGLEQFGEKEAASIIVTTLWATQRKRRRGANKRGIISIMVIISNTIFKLACNIQNKTENPSKDALQKAESLRKLKIRKMTRLTWVTRQTRQTRLTRLTRLTRPDFIF